MPSENTTVTEPGHHATASGATSAQPDGEAGAISLPPQHKKPKVERVQSYLTVLSTSIGILGAVGTAFVWVAANICVGDVEIKPDKQVDAIMVKAVDKKGQQGIYYGNHVQLMPGRYHLEIGIPDKQPTKHLDVNVQLWKHTVIPYTVPAALAPAAQADATAAPSADNQAQHKRWWQFWRKKDGAAGSQAAAQ